jgi:hypothetical protein
LNIYKYFGYIAIHLTGGGGLRLIKTSGESAYEPKVSPSKMGDVRSKNFTTEGTENTESWYEFSLFLLTLRGLISSFDPCRNCFIR